MRGHQELVKMRKQGSIPDCVWIDTWRDYMPLAEEWVLMDNAQAHLQIDVDDRIDRLDLRCVHGLPCYIQGDKENEVNQMRDSCIRVGASRVIAYVMQRFGKDEFISFRLDSLTDTDGVLGAKPEMSNG